MEIVYENLLKVTVHVGTIRISKLSFSQNINIH